MKKTLTRIIGVVVFSCLFPALASAQFLADLRIETFSVYSTLPERDGFRRVSVSFRIVNRGKSFAGSSTTRVSFDNSAVDFATPGLKPPPDPGIDPVTRPGRGTSGLTQPDVEAAYISHSMRTRSTQVVITVQADALNVVRDDRTNNKLVFTATLNLQAGRWRSIGPSEIQDVTNTFGDNFGVGRVTTIAVDARLPTRIYLGARGSGLWKSSDDGATWFPIGDSLPTAQIDAIGIYPNDRDRVVVATPSGVFESRDGGSVWSLLTSENIGAKGSGGGALLIADKINPPLYVSTLSGLRISTDGGRTWPTVRLPGAPQGFPPPRVFSLQFSTTDPSHLFASTANFPGVFEAKDGGLTSASWRMLTGCGSSALPSFPAQANVWIAESRGHRWVSFRDGTNTSNAQLWRSTLQSCPRDGFTEHEWEKVSLSEACGKSGFSYLFAHPDDPSVVFKGGVNLCRSTSSGTNLTKVSGVHVDHHAIVATSSGMMFFGTDGGIYRSRDMGKTMEFLSVGLNNTEFLKIDTDGRGPRFVVGGSQDNFTATWNGVSPVWNLLSGGGVDLTDSSLVAFDRADMRGVYEIAQSTRQVRLLKPGGGSVKLGDSSLPNCKSYNETPAVFRSMASTGDNPRLVITCEGIWSGPPWRRIQPRPPGDEDFVRLKLHPSGILVAVTDRGRVFFGRFNQPPLTEAFRTPRPSSPTAITFDQLNRFYISTNDTSAEPVLGSIHRLECFFSCVPENVWTTPGEITAITIDPRAPNTLLAAVRNRGVFRGIRNAPNNWTWTEYNNGLPFGVTVTDLQPQSNGGIVAATFGRGAFQLFSRIDEPPSTPTARGFITSYERQRRDPNRPPGFNNQTTETIELDSRPGFVFTAVSALGRFRVVAQNAIKNHRRVTIEFKPTGPQSGEIIRMF